MEFKEKFTSLRRQNDNMPYKPSTLINRKTGIHRHYRGKDHDASFQNKKTLKLCEQFISGR